MTDEENYFGYLFTLKQEKAINLFNYVRYCIENSLKGQKAFDLLPQYDLTTADIPVYIYKRYLRPY